MSIRGLIKRAKDILTRKRVYGSRYGNQPPATFGRGVSRWDFSSKPEYRKAQRIRRKARSRRIARRGF